MANDNIKDNKSDEKGFIVGRRDILKGLATVPVLGAFAYAAYRKNRLDKIIQANSVSTRWI
jgi:hypothetical protein